MSQRSALLAAVLVATLLTACASSPQRDLAVEELRRELIELRSNPDARNYAALAISDAERALERAEMSSDDVAREHYVYLTERYIELARVVAQRRLAEQQAEDMDRERDQILLEARAREAERARRAAEQARQESLARQDELERIQELLAEAREQSLSQAQQAELARLEAEQARALANAQAREADLARREAELAQRSLDTMRRQLEALQARQTDRGLVFTLGDIVFEFGEASLRAEVKNSLDRVVDFLAEYPQRQVRVEGHTDSRGAASFNLRLSQQRAEAVVAALGELGVDTSRVEAVGLGQDVPVASNDTPEGRAQNRRVEIIVLDE
jgi:outer membrane protein OmpA-like peptidoglycan-associated protein